MGLEPTASTLARSRSSHLSYYRIAWKLCLLSYVRVYGSPRWRPVLGPAISTDLHGRTRTCIFHWRS